MTGSWMTDSALEKLEIFTEMVLRYGRSFTSHDTKEELWNLSIVDSAIGWSLVNECVQKPKRVIDVGSGAGFPAIVIAILSPDVDVYAVEKKKKAAFFMEMVKDRLGLSNFFVISDDIRNVDIRGAIITSRAVAPISRFLALLIDKNLDAIFLWKGPSWKKEMNGVSVWYPFCVKEYSLTHRREQKTRYIIGLRRYEEKEAE